MVSKDLTNQVNNLQSSLREYNWPVKTEETDTIKNEIDDHDPKNETPIRDSAFLATTKLIVGDWGNSWNIMTQGTMEGSVGVIAPETGCGSLPWIMLGTDDEDHNNISYISGWVGNSKYDKSIWTPDLMNIQFCIVDVNDFSRRKSEAYAVLNLNINYYEGTSIINTYQDNEDKSNGNYTYTNATSPITGLYPWTTTSPGPLHFDENTKLSFLYFPKSNSVSAWSFHSYPDIYTNYGVFGEFGSKTGIIFHDDEDKNNANDIAMHLWNNVSAYNDYYHSDAVPFLGISHMIEQTSGGSSNNANTLYYVSKVTGF
jgi:hypothetical protein